MAIPVYPESLQKKNEGHRDGDHRVMSGTRKGSFSIKLKFTGGV
jgi:hypothetical protein